jgi:hypothetical protein
MQARFFPFVILIAGLLLACAQKQTVTTTKTAPTPPTEPQTKGHYDGPRFGGPGKTDSLFFSMERTPCFGQCKAYRINVYRSGYATFEGRSNVELEGMHFGHVGLDTLEPCCAKPRRSNFSNWRINTTATSLTCRVRSSASSGATGTSASMRGSVPREVQKLFRTGGRLALPPALAPAAGAGVDQPFSPHRTACNAAIAMAVRVVTFVAPQ